MITTQSSGAVDMRFQRRARSGPEKLLLVFVCATLSLSAQEPQGGGDAAKQDPWAAGTFSDFRLRSIGPALMSGRISHIAVHPEHKQTWYIGVASGGVWKTANAGITFTPVFQNEGSYSIGAVVIDPKNPSTIWVGPAKPTTSAASATATASTAAMTPAARGGTWG